MTTKTNKQDPYQALRYREFNVFLLLRFAMVFAWSMQFIVIEWEVYSLTKNPLSLGLIGLMEVIPAVGNGVVCRTYGRSAREKRFIGKMYSWVFGN